MYDQISSIQDDNQSAKKGWKQEIIVLLFVSSSGNFLFVSFALFYLSSGSWGLELVSYVCFFIEQRNRNQQHMIIIKQRRTTIGITKVILVGVTNLKSLLICPYFNITDSARESLVIKYNCVRTLPIIKIRRSPRDMQHIHCWVVCIAWFGGKRIFVSY